MEVQKKISSSNTPDFFSKEMLVTKKLLNENQLKFTYQKQLISDLDISIRNGQNRLIVNFKSFH